MRPLLQQGSRSVRSNASFLTFFHRTSQSSRSFFQPTSKQPSSICLQCQFRESSLCAPVANKRRALPAFSSRTLQQRSLSSQVDTDKSPEPPKSVPNAAYEQQVPESTPLKQEISSKSEGDIERVRDEDLPSHKDNQRWDFSKRFSDFMDEVLPKLAVVTQKVNTYTGTDYSGIEALRREIKEQEKLVKARRVAVDHAKHALDAAHAQQGSSQKEVVGLLERKHSWSAADLERYMSLIRSEHVNDQAVHAAKDSVLSAETALEEARTHLEKRERAQYHEEQIWSDTIRRNSTWVTFGLMGVNIFLLLATLLVIEPWRRRRMVREIRNALDAQMVAIEARPFSPIPIQPTSATEIKEGSPVEPLPTEPPPASATETQPTSSTEAPLTPPMEDSMNKVVPPVEEDLESIEVAELAGSLASELDNESESPVTAHGEGSSLSSVAPGRRMVIAWKNKVSADIGELFSEQPISLRRVDFTAAVLQAAAAGAAMSGLVLFGLLRRT